MRCLLFSPDRVAGSKHTIILVVIQQLQKSLENFLLLQQGALFLVTDIFFKKKVWGGEGGIIHVRNMHA